MESKHGRDRFMKVSYFFTNLPRRENWTEALMKSIGPILSAAKLYGSSFKVLLENADNNKKEPMNLIN